MASSHFFEDLQHSFALHSLTVEDIVNANQLPKLDVHEGYLFVVIRIPWKDEKRDSFQVALLLTDTTLITIQEHEQNLFAPLYQRLKTYVTGKIRTLGVDYLFYACLDLLMDLFLNTLRTDMDLLSTLEEEVLSGRSDDLTPTILQMKKSIHVQRKVFAGHSNGSYQAAHARYRLYIQRCYTISARFTGSYAAIPCNKRLQPVPNLRYSAPANGDSERSIKRSDEIPDPCSNGVYSADIHCRHLRDEFQQWYLPVEYARAELGVGVSGSIGSYAGHGDPATGVLL